MIVSLKALLSGFKAQPNPHQPALAREARAVTPVPLSGSAGGGGAPADVSRPVITSRATQRALITADGSVGGFEFSVDAADLKRLGHDGADVVERTAHVAALLVATRLTVFGRRMALARIPATWMLQASPGRNEAGTWIAIDFDPDVPISKALLARVVRQIGYFREAGARLIWDVRQDLGMEPDGWWLRPAQDQPIAALLDEMKARATQIRKLPVIAADLATLEDIEQALLGGVRFACGNMAPARAEPAPVDSMLSPDAQRVAQLIGQLAAGEEASVIASAIKGDVGLTVKLLQQVNSARFAHLGGVGSIDQAIALMGRDELQRWLMVVLAQYGKQRRLSSALQEVALWRARLFELLAIERREAQPAYLFTLGLATMLGVILKMDNDKVAATLSLPAESVQALAGNGPWHLYVRVADHLESQTTSDANATTDGFGSAERLLELSAEAWEWAEQTKVPAQAEPS